MAKGYISLQNKADSFFDESSCLPSKLAVFVRVGVGIDGGCRDGVGGDNPTKNCFGIS